jgi:hypothetical protein
MQKNRLKVGTEGHEEESGERAIQFDYQSINAEHNPYPKLVRAN